VPVDNGKLKGLLGMGHGGGGGGGHSHGGGGGFRRGGGGGWGGGGYWADGLWYESPILVVQDLVGSANTIAPADPKKKPPAS
jgi:hypothetical protein